MCLTNGQYTTEHLKVKLVNHKNLKSIIQSKNIKWQKLHHNITSYKFDDSPPQPSIDQVYNSNEFSKWDAISDERAKYYTKKKSIAGLASNLSYFQIKEFNTANFDDDWLVDIGCGNGEQVNYFSGPKDRYIGVDYNFKKLEMLSTSYPQTNLLQGDVSRLPFKDKTIRYMFSSNCFEHLWYLPDALMEFHRCLKDDGTLVSIFPTEGGLWNVGRALISKPFFKKKYPNIDFDVISQIEHCNNAAQIIKTMKLFFDVKLSFVPFLLPSIYTNLFVCVKAQKKKNSWL